MKAQANFSLVSMFKYRLCASERSTKSSVLAYNELSHMVLGSFFFFDRFYFMDYFSFYI